MMILCSYALSAGVGGFGFGMSLIWPRVRRARAELAESRWRADHDPLTGLPNRAALRRRYEQELAAGRPCAMALLDLDGFKGVNDTWGHQAGDALLTAMARRLSATCPPSTVVGRLAGDEFLVLLPTASGSELRSQVVSILARVASPCAVDDSPDAGTRIALAASAGLALPISGAAWSEQLERADIALYQAKKSRGSTVVFRSGMSHSGTGYSAGRLPRTPPHIAETPIRVVDRPRSVDPGRPEPSERALAGF